MTFEDMQVAGFKHFTSVEATGTLVNVSTVAVVNMVNQFFDIMSFKKAVRAIMAETALCSHDVMRQMI